MIGVDSLRNVSGAQTGALDPSNDMFWDWNTGYIFFKLEGRYGTASIEDAEYSIHVGGFEAPYSCIQTTQVNFPATFNVQDNGNHQIDFDVKVDEIFSNPKDISIEYYYSQVTSGPKIFQDISLNYKDMFSVRNTK